MDVKKLLAKLSLDEKISIIYGRGFYIPELPSIGLERVYMADGPQGIRLEDGRKSTALPCSMALAATFDTEAAREYGNVLGAETRGAGYDIILGPAVNLMRTPQCGRNFEYMGEDPVLAGEIASGYISGVQEKGCGTSAKHFACNNQEWCRTFTNAKVSERALQEMYLRAFEIMVHKANPTTLMCSYNRLNGAFTSEHRHLLHEILREQWGYDGLVMADWGAIHTCYQAAVDGVDLDMPGEEGSWFNKPLHALVDKGLIPVSVIDEKAERVLELAARLNCFKGMKRVKGALNTAKHHEISRKISQKAMVLLKNDGMLPLKKKSLTKLAVIGPNANRKLGGNSLTQGGGSGMVHSDYEITPLEGLKKYLGKSVEIAYHPGPTPEYMQPIDGALLTTLEGKPGLTATFFRNDGDGAPLNVLVLNKGVEKDDDSPVLGQEICKTIDYCFREDVPWNDDAPNVTTAYGYRNIIGQWEGYITPKKSGTMRLGLFIQGNAEAKMSLDGNVIVDTGKEGLNPEQNAKEIKVTAGKKMRLNVSMVRPWGELVFRLTCAQSQEKEIKAAEKLAKSADTVLYFGGRDHRFDTECIVSTLNNKADIPSYDLPDGQSEFISRLCRANANTAVILNGGSPMNVEGFVDQVKALMMVWYPGMETGRAIAEVLFGDASPDGRLPFTWAKQLNDYPCHADGTYPGDTTLQYAHSDYLEGIYFGYRHFDRAGIAPRFPFGHGLTYTNFVFNVQSVACRGRNVTAKVQVANIGKKAGAEVVQLYVGDAKSSVDRPVKELEAFAKVYLKPGESQEVTLKLAERDFQFFSEKKNKFVFEPGEFVLHFATDANTVFESRNITLK